MTTLPHFVGIGALKAGTTSIHAALSHHPDVALPRHRKEVMFFDQHWHRGVGWYAEHFAHAGQRVAGEISPNYLYEPQAPARIAHTLPDAKLFAVVRDPVARFHSQYKFAVKELGYRGTPETFAADHPNAVARGRYAEQLGRYLDHVDAERLAVFAFDDLVGQPVETLALVQAHLGLRRIDALGDVDQAHNASEVPRAHGLYVAGRAVAAWLYRHDLAPLVHGLKRLGVRSWFLPKAPNRSPPVTFQPLSSDLRARLTEIYADDQALLCGLWPRIGHRPASVTTDTAPNSTAKTP
jgi:hypothetical protein